MTSFLLKADHDQLVYGGVEEYPERPFTREQYMELAPTGASLEPETRSSPVPRVHQGALDDIVSALPCVVLSVKPERNWPIEYISPNIARYGYSSEELILSRHGFFELVQDNDSLRVELERLVHGTNGIHRAAFEFQLYTADGLYLPCQSQWQVTQSKWGGSIRLVGMLSENPENGHIHTQEETNILANELLCLLVHDLRSPLTVLMGSADILGMRTAGADASISQPLRTIQTETLRLKDLCEEVVLLTKLGMGQIPLRREPVDVYDLLQRCAVVCTQSLNSKGLDITVQRPKEPIALVADARMLERAVVIFILNSIRRLSRGQNICLISSSSKRERPMVEIIVSDDGPALSEETRAAIFKQTAIAHIRSQGVAHLGLRLCLVKVIAEAHGGTALVRPNAQGQESFVLQLPQTSPHVS